MEVNKEIALYLEDSFPLEMKPAEDTFEPEPWATNPHLQTIFGSLSLRTLGRNAMLEQSREMIVEGGNGVRLLGYLSRSLGEESPGLVILIHGWEGSSESAYILSTGRYLFERGFDVFRLNLRDHGRSHHLNDGLFHGALTDEVLTAAVEISRSARRNSFIVGFSLGGNFALRIALRAPQAGIGNLKQVVCISPPLDPYKATLTIDRGVKLYRHYFLRKWKRSLMTKQSLFPHRYDFRGLLRIGSCMELTEAMMGLYYDFPSTADYFGRYTLTGNALEALAVPVAIIAAEDDPVVPVDDVCGLEPNGFLRCFVQKRGGHCGFLRPFPFGCWYERKVYDLLVTS